MKHTIIPFIILLSMCSAFAQDKSVKIDSAPVDLNLQWKDAGLKIELQFQDRNGNNALDAEESASILVTVKNNGEGKAYNVKLTGRLTGNSNGVSGSLDQTLGTIDPGGSAAATMKLTGAENLKEGQIVLRFEAADRHKQKAPPMELTLETRAIVPPILAVVDLGIDDDQQGDSYGNSNRRIDKGETIEVAALVQNRGQGDALGVEVEVIPVEGLFYQGRSKFSLGDLAPGDHREVAFAFTIPRSFSGGELPFKLKISESRGKYGKTETLDLALDKQQQGTGSLQAQSVTISGRERQTVMIGDTPGLMDPVDTEIPEAAVINRDAVAVIIGNCNYRDRTPDVPNVDFAVNDAAIMKEYLLNTLGYREGNILYATDADLSEFNRIFGTRGIAEGALANMVKPGKSDVFIYYSGHGAPDVNEKQGYFVPIGCRPNDVRLNGYPISLFYNNLSRIEAKSTTVVIDACFSGGSGTGAMLINAASPIGIQVTDPAVNLPNGVVFTSSSNEEISSWYPDKKHGLFTYFFLKGLRGEADKNGDGTVAAGELYSYVSDRSDGVPYWARRLHGGRIQTPGMYGKGDRIVRGKVK